MNSKRKGSAGERELLEILRRHGIEAARNDQMYVGGAGLPDILATISGREWHIEAKRCESLRLNEWLEQAYHDAAKTPQRIPVVIFRRSRQKWHVAISLDNLFSLLGISEEEGGNAETP